MHTLSIASTGFLFGLSLIAAIGAQNAFLLKQGMARQHVGVIVAICTASDIVLIAAGVAGIGYLVQSAPGVIEAIKWGGFAFLLWYGGSALIRAFRRAPLTLTDGVATTLRSAVLTCLGMTWLNPHVYLDTVLLMGSLAATHGPGLRWVFAIGAMCASAIWFAAVGWGARFLAPLFTRPIAARLLEGTIGATMLLIGVRVIGAF